MATILIAEDDMYIRRMVKDYLVSCRYQVREAKDGQEALEQFFSYNNEISLIILDVMMPCKNGYEVLKEIRESSTVPIIMLTAKSQEEDQLISFRYGVDDFLAKPFSPAILLAHVKAILKRCGQDKNKIIRVGGISIDTEKREVVIDDSLLELTPKEYDLLLFFVRNSNIVFQREQLLNAVWSYSYEGDLRTVDTHVKQLRAKLLDRSSYIKTIYGIGYEFEVSDVSVH